MANLNIKFNNKNYSIDPASLADATARLEAHLMGMMEERLEGDGAEFYTLAPTALSFRSTAPLNELQEIQINGVTVDPANYTLEEGSTIVTFPIDYLKTLNVGSYEVAVASDSKTVKGGFSVKAPELNEHGFYYNQPYTAYVAAFGNNQTFFIRDDGTYDLMGYNVGGAFEDISIATYDYTISDNIIAFNTPIGIINGTISSDGAEIYGAEIATTFKLGDESIVADEDYVYMYDGVNIGGYVVRCIDKTKEMYGAIRTNIHGKPTTMLAHDMFAIVDVYYFDNTVLMEVPQMPNSVVYIGVKAFYQCVNIQKVDIPNGVIRICGDAFRGCTGLTSVVINAGITTIDAYAFYNCTNLANISYTGTIAEWNAITIERAAFDNVPATHVHCTDGDVAL